MPTSVRAEIRELARLAGPVAASHAGAALMGVVDTAVVGRVSASALGAVALSNGLFFALAIVGGGTMLGLDPLVSQAFGAGDAVRARRWLWQGVALSFLVAAALVVPMALLPLVLVPAGIDPAVAEIAHACMLWRLPGLPAFYLYFATRAYLLGANKTQPLYLATILANVVNLVFAVTLVPTMGAPGSSLAMSLAMVAQLAVVAWAAAKLPVEGWSRRLRAAARGELLRIVRVGLPVGLQMGAEVGVFALAGVLAGRLGTASLAAHQIVLTWASLTFTIALGIGNAGSVRVGWAVGGGDSGQARRAGLTAFVLGAAVMSAGGLLFWAAPTLLARAMTDQPEVVAAAGPLFAVAALFQISDGVQGVGAGVLRGAADTRFAFVANVVGHYAVGLPLAVLLAFTMGVGVTGLWWGLCAGLTAVALALFARFWRLSSRPIVPVDIPVSDI